MSGARPESRRDPTSAWGVQSCTWRRLHSADLDHAVTEQRPVGESTIMCRLALIFVIALSGFFPDAALQPLAFDRHDYGS